MNEHAKAWIEELKLDKYQQGQGTLLLNLSDVDQYCCLGVACQKYIDASEGHAAWIPTTSYINWVADDRFESDNDGFMPSIVKDWIGLADEIEGKLVVLNDMKQLSFREIAEWLENPDNEAFKGVDESI